MATRSDTGNINSG